MNVPVNQMQGSFAQNYLGINDYSQSPQLQDFSGGIFGGPGSNYGANASNASPGMDFSGKMGAISQGIGAFTSLAQLWGAFKQLGFQKKAFKFAQEGTKRNFNAEAKAYNNQVDDQLTNRTAMASYNGWAAPDQGVFSQRKIAEWS